MSYYENLISNLVNKNNLVQKKDNMIYKYFPLTLITFYKKEKSYLLIGLSSNNNKIKISVP